MNSIQEADGWLNMEEVGPSPITYMATDPRTGDGRVFTSRQPPTHQRMRDDLPTENAELTTAKYMKRCTYFSKDSQMATGLCRSFGRGLEYIERNISVRCGAPGKSSYNQSGWKGAPRMDQTPTQTSPRVRNACPATCRTCQRLGPW